MREAERRREIKDYYLSISADEITSHLTPASFDLWESIARYRRELRIGSPGIGASSGSTPAGWRSAAAWATWRRRPSIAATTC